MIYRINNTKRIAKEYRLTKFSNDKISEYKYEETLKLASEENKKIKSSYYKIKKAIPLYNELIKYKQNHLYFIKDFNIPFDDNLSKNI